MRGSRREWIILATLVAVMAGVSALVGGRGADEEREGRPNPSTYNARASGSKGLYLWLQEVGLRVRRWERPLIDLPEEATTLLILGPRLPVEAMESKALERWVRGGGVLVLADDSVGGPVPHLWEGSAVQAFGLEPRLGGKPGTLRPAFPSVYAAGVEAIQPTGWVRFQRKAAEGWAPLFADANGHVVVIKRLEKGMVFALADPSILSNARLETAGHARLILNVLQAHAQHGVVLVDEFHHGHGDQRGFFRYLKGTAVPWILAQAALVFLILLVARGTRFGRPVPVVEAARISSLEYVGALGDLYRRAGARRLAVEALAHGFRRRLSEALGAPPGEDAGRLGMWASRRYDLRAERVTACLSPGPGDATSDEALVRFAQTLYRLEKRLRFRPVRASTDRARERG